MAMWEGNQHTVARNTWALYMKWWWYESGVRQGIKKKERKASADGRSSQRKWVTARWGVYSWKYYLAMRWEIDP